MMQMENINLLYCFDKNYNYQAFSSIISFLDHSDSELNIYIIHQNLADLENIPENILSHKNLKTIEKYQFGEFTNLFPNLENAHISEATYYRLFISSILPKTVKNLLYIDCDVICVNTPNKIIHDTFKDLNASDFIISAKTEFDKKNSVEEVFIRLKLKSQHYFNAGVMFIDLLKWNQKEIQVLSTDIIENSKLKFTYWDQDILNIIFDGNYLHLPEALNYKVSPSKNDNHLDTSNIYFLHFQGSNKPWSVEGVLSTNSYFYQSNFKKLNIDNYHIVHKWKKYSLSVFFQNLTPLIKNKNINLFRYTITLLKSLSRNN
jgi:lipopolysaccharide biosynthesis glycosyltransferase